MKDPTEKAIELIQIFYKCMPFKDNKLTSCNENPYLIIEMEELAAKQCASIAVDEIIKAIDFDWMEVQNLEQQHRYWQEVKQEINNL
jgi:hypothetical protein